MNSIPYVNLIQLVMAVKMYELENSDAPRLLSNITVKKTIPTGGIESLDYCQHASLIKDNWERLGKVLSLDKYPFILQDGGIPILLCADSESHALLSMKEPFTARVVNTKGPSAAQMASTAITAVFNWAKMGFKVADETVLAERMAVCEKCDQWDPKGWAGTGKCKKCGCSGIKLKLATEGCPLGKWNAVNNS